MVNRKDKGNHFRQWDSIGYQFESDVVEQNGVERQTGSMPVKRVPCRQSNVKLDVININTYTSIRD